jgi:AraC family transcriptional regulator
MMMGGGIMVELVQSTSHDRIEYRYLGSSHLLVAREQVIRRDGETFVEGTPRSTLRNLTSKLTFVPPGHEYFEWHQPRTPTCVMYFYFDAAELQAQSSQAASSDIPLAPQMLFEDTVLWGTALKLKGLVESPLPEHRPYFEALSAVLVQELLRLNRGMNRLETSVKGGLAAWQQRMATAYIEEHLAEQIPLATLAQLARLSPCHFNRAFKQSFGVPPHRYHTGRRIEHAKALLENRTVSVTDIGLTLGFRETSSFTTAFRKATGVTPSRYHRSFG